MKNQKMYLTLLALVMLLAGVSLYAQDGPPRGGRGPGGPREMMRMLPVMTALDADGDGVISAAEINNAALALRKLDKNNDGQLTEEELRPAFAGGPGGRGPGFANPEEMVKQLLEFDKDGDGQLSKTELPERMHGLFARGDADQNGFLTKEELQKVAEAQAARAPRGAEDDHHNEGRRPPRPPVEQ